MGSKNNSAKNTIRDNWCRVFAVQPLLIHKV